MSVHLCGTQSVLAFRGCHTSVRAAQTGSRRNSEVQRFRHRSISKPNSLRGQQWSSRDSSLVLSTCLGPLLLNSVGGVLPNASPRGSAVLPWGLWKKIQVTSATEMHPLHVHTHTHVTHRKHTSPAPPRFAFVEGDECARL